MHATAVQIKVKKTKACPGPLKAPPLFCFRPKFSFTMEVVESIPAHIDDQGASNAADRILRLSEAVGLVVDQVVDPLVHPALARRLLSPLIPDVSASAELLTQAADGIRSSFQVRM